MRKRSIMSRKTRRSGDTQTELDITSLMDIITILLFFLLKNFNESGVIINVPQGIKLPLSASMTLNNPGVVVQASKEKIWVDDELILDLTTTEQNVYDGRYGIIPLYDHLKQKKITYEETFKSVPNTAPFSGKVNLVLDKEINYDFIRRILHSSHMAGYGVYQFTVLSKEN